MINHSLRNTQGTKKNQIKLLCLPGFPGLGAEIRKCSHDSGSRCRKWAALWSDANQTVNCIHKVKHRCVTSGLSAWSYINFAEILSLTKVYLVLSEPKAQSRKWEELFLSLDHVGGIALHLLLGSFFLVPLMSLSRGYKLVLTFQLVLKHLIFTLEKTYELFTTCYLSHIWNISLFTLFSYWCKHSQK